jgi:hypothetical protein
MGERDAALADFLSKYTGVSTGLLLRRELEKTGIIDLNSADELRLMNLTDSIVRDILAPVISKGRLPIARSELMGVLGLDDSMYGLPLTIDGVRVLPERIHEESEEYYKNEGEFILAQEFKKYGLKPPINTDSPTRVRIVECFVEHQFGVSGRAIIDSKIDELGVRDVCEAPQYNKILLMEYVLQSMLAFYVKPSRARMLRSELLSILDIELELVQGPDPLDEKARRNVTTERKKIAASLSKRRRVDFEDLITFLIKRELSARGVQDSRQLPAAVRHQVLSAVICNLLGGMTRFVFSRIQTASEPIRLKFQVRYLHNYLNGIMTPDDISIAYSRLDSLLHLTQP